MQQHSFGMKKILFLSLPLIFSNLINAANSFISMYLISKIDTEALAAGALITSTYGLIVMIIVSMLYSVSITVGKMQGGGQYKEIGGIVNSGIVLTIIMGIPFTYIMLHMDVVFELLGQQHSISALAGDYFRGIAFGFIPSLVGAVYMQFFMGTLRASFIMAFTIVGVLVNTFLSYLLIFGYGSLAAQDVYGGGLASAVTAWILLLITVVTLKSSSKYKSYQLFTINLADFKYILILLKIGAPISVQYSTEILAFSIITYFMGLIGMDALAAQQITLQCSMICIMIIMAISQSSSVLISQELNKGEGSASAIRIANSSFLLGLVIMSLIALVYYYFPMSLIGLYLNIDDPLLSKTIDLTKNLLFITAFTQVFDGCRNIAAGLLRGSGDTKSSMWTGIVSCWFIGIPSALVLGFILNFGAIGIRFGMLLGMLYGGVILMHRFYSRNKVKDFELIFST